MVRVGGGWVSLDEFLLKNDPCRAKGRTNVELREPLAEGVSQSIATFRPKSPFVSNIGPITKVCRLSSFLMHLYFQQIDLF